MTSDVNEYKSQTNSGKGGVMLLFALPGFDTNYYSELNEVFLHKVWRLRSKDNQLI